MAEAKVDHYPLDLYVLILSSLTVFLAVETTRAILPLHVTDMGASPLELGLIVGVLSFALMLSKIPMGVISERFSAVYVIILAIVGQSISQFLYSIAPDLIFFYPIQVLHALTVAALVPVAISVSQKMAPPGKTGEVMGVFLTSYGLANSIGPYLCSYLLTFMTYKEVFQTASIIPLLGIIPLFALRKTKTLTVPVSTKRNSPFASLNSIFHSRNLMVLTFLRLTYAITYAIFLTLFIVYAENTLLLAPALIVFLFGTRGISDMLLRVPAGRLVDKVDYKWCILLACAGLSVVYFLISFVTDVILLIIIMIAFGLAVGLRVVSEWTMLADQSDEAARNVAAAYLSTMFNIGFTVGAVVAGIMATVLEFETVFRIASILMLVALVSSLLIKKKQSRVITTANKEI